MAHYRISSTTTRRGRVTEVTMFVGADQAGLPGFYFNGHGSALRSKNDVRLDEIGETIALGRAFQDLGQQIEAIGHSKCVTKEEYQRVALLQYRREVTKNSAVAAIDEVVRANLLDPTEAKREHAVPSDGNLPPYYCDNPELQSDKREQYCTQGCGD